MKSTRLLFVMLWAWLALSVQAQEGAWKGELNFQGTKLPLVFHFADNGCTMDSPSQGARVFRPKGKFWPTAPFV